MHSTAQHGTASEGYNTNIRNKSLHIMGKIQKRLEANQPEPTAGSRVCHAMSPGLNEWRNRRESNLALNVDLNWWLLLPRQRAITSQLQSNIMYGSSHCMPTRLHCRRTDSKSGLLPWSNSHGKGRSRHTEYHLHSGSQHALVTSSLGMLDGGLKTTRRPMLSYTGCE
ncbi:uncharacterized protein HMPREF1120_02888 [Exophiala dermatitidis NIH/UT8656]|uniref:Uncharacterized protein n=1 Tax=Exophiala dermatitidis (strain ATCC 34100 / CBS 525.76 / NIH/UT8656) TaxID=858893 RepID=H6BRE2_EXODN|nr:uncharacterized protein HMPREF1120_02888 [Exophiala dermatitidis NIH/UT8656]EHY54723.1 hypothetical protein HMPREF1120_02888 [Exophiala dermatitidis NIH/UT8656]